jgi:hypothetical protein
MSLLAEELIEEWLNRQGYFTIRGTKIGVQEIDLLAIRTTTNGVECRQIEVQASVRPVSYISSVPKEIQRQTGHAAGSAKAREDGELREGIREWITKKFDHPEKEKIRRHLAPGTWSRELIVHVVKHQRELELLSAAGITIRYLTKILADLKRNDFLIGGAAGAHLVDLVAIATEHQ